LRHLLTYHEIWAILLTIATVSIGYFATDRDLFEVFFAPLIYLSMLFFIDFFSWDVIRPVRYEPATDAVVITIAWMGIIYSFGIATWEARF